jgi:hypothetical protein
MKFKTDLWLYVPWMEDSRRERRELDLSVARAIDCNYKHNFKKEFHLPHANPRYATLCYVEYV